MRIVQRFQRRRIPIRRAESHLIRHVGSIVPRSESPAVGQYRNKQRGQRQASNRTETNEDEGN
jgi:ribosomal protein L3